MLAARALVPLTLATLAFACGRGDADAATAEADVTAKSVGELAVDIAELSGLAVRRHAGELQLLAVGDATYELAVGALDPDDVEATTFHSVDLAALLPEANRNGSQWEAVASDASGRIFVLEESPGRIFVFDPTLRRLERTIELRVERTRDDDLDDLAKDWAKEANSRGEGLALLQNGHVLVLKEKDARALVEFGPPGETPQGFSPELAVRSADEFPLSVADVFVPLHTWKLDKSNKLPDLSELALAADGTLFVTSDRGAALAALPARFDTSNRELELERVTKLPNKTKSAEALVFLDDGRAIVGCDIGKKNNALILAPLRR